MKIRDMYLNGEYLKNNPSWDQEDAPWKAEQIVWMLERHHLYPKTVGEVGCGSGEILASLATRMPGSLFSGYEISPAAIELCRQRENASVQFTLGNFIDECERTFDLVLLIDLIEHLEDCFSFLRAVKPRGKHVILHVPLEMYVLSVIYPQFLLGQWRKVGHLHFFSKDLVLELLKDTGYEIVDYTYTAGFALPRDYGIKDKFLQIPRKLFFPLAPDFTVKVFGGYSLLVLVR